MSIPMSSYLMSSFLMNLWLEDPRTTVTRRICGWRIQELRLQDEKES